MVAVTNLLDLVLVSVSNRDLDRSTSKFGAMNIAESKTRWLNACRNAASFAEKAQSVAVQRMAAMIETHDVIMTHSISSTLKKVFDELSRGDASVRIFVTESRPGDEGKLLARYLVGIGMRTSYITEAQINIFMPEMDKVVVGADAVLSDGSIINKCGTSLMAMSAQYHNVPVFVCAESFKRIDGMDFVLEQMDPVELKLEVEGVKAFNGYFERVEADLITQWVH